MKRDPHKRPEYKAVVAARRHFDEAMVVVECLRRDLAYWESEAFAAVDNYRDAMIKWNTVAGRTSPLYSPSRKKRRRTPAPP